MTRQTIVYYFNPSNRSGYDYIEVDHANRVLSRGNSASHQGHNVNNISVEVKTRKELHKLIEALEWSRFEYKETLR